MKQFEIDSMKNSIHFGKTKAYFEEVLISYQVGSYRSTVVMLWSVAISDIIYKLQHLVDLYGDASANEILNDVKGMQDEDARSSSWELGVVEKVFEKTNLLDSADYENLRYLQKQRHLCAHPVLKENLDLHNPNKETVRALIRNTLEGLLIKPPFYTQKVITEILEDLDESKGALYTYEKVKTYVENRYLNRMTDDVEMVLFRTLWKFTFKLENEKCNENRNLNLRVLRVLTKRHNSKVLEAIQSDQDYYSNISGSGDPLDFLVFYLSKNVNFFQALTEDAKLKIHHVSETTIIGKVCGWFVSGSLDKHFDYLVTWIESDDYPKFTDDQWTYLLELSDSKEWECKYAMLVAAYYGASANFDAADTRFSQCVLPNLKYFDEESAKYLFEKIEGNNQVYWRSRANSDHIKLREQLEKILPNEFDYSKFPKFDETSKEEDEESS